MLLLIVPALFAAAAAPAATINPIAPALAGKLECHLPDERTKTCRSIGSYKPLGANRYTNITLGLLSPQEPVTLEVTSEVQIKNGAVCGRLLDQDLAKATLNLGGKTLDEADAAPTKAQIARAMEPLLNKEICTRYVPSSSGRLVTKVSVDGTARPDFGQAVKWVAPGDGYKVTP
jgi:hypothetical protein